MNQINSLEALTESFRRLPGIGAKLAQRLAMHVINMSDEEAKAFAEAIILAKTSIHHCPVCLNLTDGEICSVCSDAKRDRSVICVVETPTDLMAIDKTHEYNGLFHVLHGVISPIDNVSPADLHIKELIKRLESDEVKEVIVATNPTVEGDATALYLSKLIKQLGVSVTRLAFGIPVGGDLEYTDELTLQKAIENRREIQ